MKCWINMIVYFIIFCKTTCIASPVHSLCAWRCLVYGLWVKMSSLLLFNKVKVSDAGLTRAIGVGPEYFQRNVCFNLKLPVAWCVCSYNLLCFSQVISAIVLRHSLMSCFPRYGEQQHIVVRKMIFYCCTKDDILSRC